MSVQNSEENWDVQTSKKNKKKKKEPEIQLKQSNLIIEDDNFWSGFENGEDPIIQMEKEKKRKEIDKIIKKDAKKEIKKNTKINDQKKLEQKRKQKIGQPITHLKFAKEEPKEEPKKKKKTISTDESIPSTLEGADQLLTNEKLKLFIQLSKKAYPKEESLQINEVASKIQYLYQNIRVKNAFHYNEPLKFLSNYKILTDWFSTLESSSISVSFLYLFKNIFNNDGSDKKEGKVIGFKIFYQLLIRSYPNEFIESISFIYQDFTKTGKPLDNFLWILSQIWVVEPKLALEAWSKTLCKELKNAKIKEKDSETILHFLKSCLNEIKNVKKLNFDVDSFLWIQENAFKFDDFKELYSSIKEKLNSSNELFEKLLIQFSKENGNSQANYSMELKQFLRNCLIESNEVCVHWSKIFSQHIKSSTDLAEFLLTKNMNPLLKKDDFLNSIKNIQETILKIQNGNVKEKHHQKISKEKLKDTNFLFFQLTESKASASFSHKIINHSSIQIETNTQESKFNEYFKTNTELLKPVFHLPLSKESQKIIDNEKCTRGYKKYRDFKKNPILIIGHGSFGTRFKKLHDEKCSVPCYFSNDFSKETLYKADAFFTDHEPFPNRTCSYQKSIHLTQENLVLPKGHDIYVNPSSHSHISWGYYNLLAYNFAQKPKKKDNEILASAFISNCGFFHHSPTPRLEILKKLMEYGVKIHSYGKCLNNVKHLIKHEDSHKQKHKTELDEINFKWLNKLNTISKYKFHLAFENSHNHGYVTEKYFQSLQVGTVPVVVGAPDIEEYQPSENSILHIRNLSDVERVAKRMIYLSKHDDEYQKMLDWKIRGPSNKFLATMQDTMAGWLCKMCFKIADQFPMKRDGDAIFVRERNSFEYRKIYLKEYTIDELHNEIKKVFKNYIPSWIQGRQNCGYPAKIGFLRIHRIVKPSSTLHESLNGYNVDNTQKVTLLKPGDRLDVVFV
eukprot:gene1082-10601_t